jgi:hypothetical protein
VEAARGLRAPAVDLRRATANLAETLDRLCDHELRGSAREDATGQLYVDLTDVRLALTAFSEGVLGPEQPASSAQAGASCRVVKVAERRWRRRRRAGWEP